MGESDGGSVAGSGSRSGVAGWDDGGWLIQGKAAGGLVWRVWPAEGLTGRCVVCRRPPEYLVLARRDGRQSTTALCRRHGLMWPRMVWRVLERATGAPGVWPGAAVKGANGAGAAGNP